MAAAQAWLVDPARMATARCYALRGIASIASQSDVDVQIEQVKERFGRLKIYTASSPRVRPLLTDIPCAG